MLFDLQGKRRRLVQVIYLGLAILMGGGLVLFGIGSSTSGGGLFDAFSGGGSAQSTSQAASELKAANVALTKDPEDTEALAEKIRATFQLAKENVNPNTGAPTAKSSAYQGQADEAWQSYLKLKPDPPDEQSASNPGPKQPDPSLAGYMLQIYDTSGLNQPADAARAAEMVALSRPTVGAYLKLTQYAAAAGQTRTADLSAAKAVDLAEPAQRDAVQKQAEAYKQAGEKAASDAEAAKNKAVEDAKTATTKTATSEGSPALELPGGGTSSAPAPKAPAGDKTAK
ncbi:MAG: hypothetical protein QOG62_1244 [Thermoleophilaceae bacterium]|nr:hypothetical protein [Thermoleophilaceae bacterium]